MTADAITPIAPVTPANPVERAARFAWKPADLRPPWRWAEENYFVPVSSMPGKWRSDNSPWVRKLMTKFADNSVKLIVVLCSAQSSKTETMLALLNWIIAEDPSPTMWVTSSDEEALKFSNERLMPSLRLCPPVAKQIPNDRTLAKSMEILFPTMMLEVVGANSKAKLQSRSRRFLLLDEVRNWPAWALPMVLKRVRTWWNSRVVILTTPEAEKDTVHMQFLDGTQERYHVPCQNAACGVRSELAFDNIKAEHPTTHQCVKWSEVPGARDADGRWDFVVLAPAIRYACPACQHMHADTPQLRRQLALGGDWVSHNPKAPPHHLSFTWSALLPPWVKWHKVVEEFLLAQSALEFGNHEPLKTFITETLGQPWQDRLRYAKTEGYLDACQEDYDPRQPWAPEARRFMSIDVQGKGGRHFYYIIRAFARGGTSRLLAYGKAWSIEEIRATMVDWNVAPQNVCIDSGHFTAEVYGIILDSGVLPNGDYAFKAFKGDRAPYYMSANQVRMPFTWSFVDPYLGTSKQNSSRPIRQILFSKTAMLDRTEALMRGLGPRWVIPKQGDMIHEYKNQVTAYERFERKATGTGEIKVEWVQKRADDHWGSCERQALVAAYAADLMEVEVKS